MNFDLIKKDIGKHFDSLSNQRLLIWSLIYGYEIFKKKNLNKKNYLFYLILLVPFTLIITYFTSIDHKKLSKCPSLEELISFKNFKIEKKFKKFHNFKGYDCDTDELWKKVVISVSKKGEIEDINQQINNYINFIYLKILNIENHKVNLTPVDNDNQMIFIQLNF